MVMITNSSNHIPFFALHAQTAADTAAAQLGQLLKPGTHLVHYYQADPNIQLTAEQKALLAKVDKALSETTDWVLHPDSTRHLTGTRDEILNDIRKKLGLTEEEWKTLQDLTDVAKKNVENGAQCITVSERDMLISTTPRGPPQILLTPPPKFRSPAATGRYLLRTLPFL